MLFRSLAPDGTLECIVEAADAGPEERAIGLVNGGIMVIAAHHLCGLVDALDSDNAKGEFCLTDIVRTARRCSSPAGPWSCLPRSCSG